MPFNTLYQFFSGDGDTPSIPANCQTSTTLSTTNQMTLADVKEKLPLFRYDLKKWENYLTEHSATLSDETLKELVQHEFEYRHELQEKLDGVYKDRREDTNFNVTFGTSIAFGGGLLGQSFGLISALIQQEDLEYNTKTNTLLAIGFVISAVMYYSRYENYKERTEQIQKSLDDLNHEMASFLNVAKTERPEVYQFYQKLFKEGLPKKESEHKQNNSLKPH